MKWPRAAGAIVAVFAALSLSGCGGSPPPANDGVFELPGDAQPGELSLDAMTHGVLGGDSDDGCVWLVEGIEEGEPVEPEMSLLWPAGYTFDTSTQQILGPDGDAIAAIGDRVAVGGGEIPAAPEWCNVADRVWSVSSIESRD